MSQSKFSLREQLKYSWFNVLLAFVVMFTVILVARAARDDRDLAECHTALMDNLHMDLMDRLGPNGETETWGPAFAKWHHEMETFDAGDPVFGVPECQG